MRIGSVRRNPQVFERLYSFETIESFGHEDDVRMQVRNQLQAWIDSAPHFGLFLRIRRVVAEFGIADEMILQPKRVDGFRQTRRERHDTVDRLGNPNRAAGFVGNFPIGWGCRKDRRSALRMRQRRAEKQGCDGGQEGASEVRTCDFFHESPPAQESYCMNKKAPRDSLGRMAWLFLAKSAALCGTGGWPGLRLFSRLQWRDRGRFTRPSPLPLPANLKFECKPCSQCVSIAGRFHDSVLRNDCLHGVA